MRTSTYYSVLALLLLLVVACGKDKLETRPSLKFRSISANPVPKGALELYIEFDYADKEGDIGKHIFFQRIRLNRNPPITRRIDTFTIPVPKLPVPKTDGQIRLRLQDTEFQDDQDDTPPENDTLTFRFALTDMADNTSDTLEVPNIVIIRKD